MFVSSGRRTVSSFFFFEKLQAIPFETRLATLLETIRRESFVLPGERESRINAEGELRP